LHECKARAKHRRLQFIDLVGFESAMAIRNSRTRNTPLYLSVPLRSQQLLGLRYEISRESADPSARDSARLNRNNPLDFWNMECTQQFATRFL
jgi:hypothetical protein